MIGSGWRDCSYRRTTLFLAPAESARHQDFMTSARALTATATERKDLFLQHGMSPTLMDDLGRALDEYAAAVLQANAGRRAHVGARADIDAVMREIMELVNQMEGINRYCFRADAELLAARKNARDLPWESGGQQEPVAPVA